MNLKTLFEKGKAAGFESQEVYQMTSQNIDIAVFEGEVDKYAMSEQGGISYRGIFDGKMGYAYTENLEDSSIDMLVHEAKENAKAIESTDKVFIFEGSEDYKSFDCYNPSLAQVPVEQKIKFILDLEAQIKAQDPRVKRLAYNAYNEATTSRRIMNTLGLDLSEKRNYCMAYAMVVVEEDGDTRTGMGYDVSETFEGLSAEKIVKEAVSEALNMLGAKPTKSRHMPVVFKNTTFAEFYSEFSGNFSAERVHKDLSKLKGKLGTQIASEKLTMIDDPHIAINYAAIGFDDEGVATQPKAIIENGVLKTYLHNLKTANIDGVESTGNATKAGFKGSIGIAPMALSIQAGEHSFDDIIESVEDGIYLISLQGLHAGIDTITGDFSLQCYGYKIENGKMTVPVSQITVAGNYYEMLNDIELIGSDLEYTVMANGFTGSPTIKIKNLAISGE